MRIIAVAINTFRESVRDKILYVLLFFAAVSIFGSKALGWISVGQDIKIVKDITLASTDVFGVLIAIFVGTSLLYKEIDKRTLYTILSQPMHRYEFVLGKYFGLMALLMVVLMVMTLVSSVYVYFLGGALDATFFISIYLVYVKLMLLTAIALLLSSMSSPIMGAIILFTVYVFGHATGVFLELPPQFNGTWTKEFLEIAYYVVPNLNTFNIRDLAANEEAVSFVYLLWATLYGFCYTVVFLLLAALAFEGKDV